MNTKVGQLFLLGLFLRHYFVDSNIRNLYIGYCRVSCIKTIFFLSFIFFSYHSFSLSYLELQIIFPRRDIGPATLDPRPRHWTRDRDIGPATRDYSSNSFDRGWIRPIKTFGLVPLSLYIHQLHYEARRFFAPCGPLIPFSRANAQRGYGYFNPTANFLFHYLFHRATQHII